MGWAWRFLVFGFMKGLVFKLLFKAMVPLVCMAGVMSYGLYMRGGDPMALFSKMIGNTVQSAKSSVSNAGNSLQSLAPGSGSSSSGDSSHTQVYKWTDANGVTHFGSRPPEASEATSIMINNNANVYQSVESDRRAQQAAAGQQQAGQTSNNPRLGPDGQPLPGVAGMNLPVAVDPDIVQEYMRTMQGSGTR